VGQQTDYNFTLPRGAPMAVATQLNYQLTLIAPLVGQVQCWAIRCTIATIMLE